MEETGFLKGIENFYEKRRSSGSKGYSFEPGLLPTYWSSSYPVLTYSLTGLLDAVEEDYKNNLAEFLQNGQEAATGFYKEPLSEENMPIGPVHKAEDVLWHGATFINGALHVLGKNPNYGFSILDENKDSQAMVRWLERLPWENPWKAGNFTYDMGCLMGTDFETTGNNANLYSMDAFFDWMDSNTDNETGWWNPKGNAPLYSCQFGGYHTLMVYWMYDRTIPDPEKMIESTLRLQSEDGSFSGYGCCGDMDCVDALVTLSRQFDICHGKVRKAMEKFYPYLMSCLTAEGGFRSLSDSSHVDLGWSLHAGICGQADACSTYFRTFTLSLVDEVLEIPWLEDVKWKHMDGFCHGRRPNELL